MTQTNTAERKTLSVRPATSRKLLARKAAEQAPVTDADGSAEALEACFPAGAAEPGGNDAAATASEAAPAAEYIEPAEDAAATAAEAASELPAPVVEARARADVAANAEPSTPAQPEPASDPASASSSTSAPAPAPLPAAAPSWSAEDERALNALLARRKAAGYQRRGRDVSGQLIRLGDVKPNPETVVAVIVGLVAAAGGTVGRAELIDLMAGATFPHSKAQPGDKGWCQGYVAGAVRNGFLAVGAKADAGVSTLSGNAGNFPEIDRASFLSEAPAVAA